MDVPSSFEYERFYDYKVQIIYKILQKNGRAGKFLKLSMFYITNSIKYYDKFDN